MSDPQTLRRVDALEKALQALRTRDRVAGGGCRTYNSVTISHTTSGVAQALSFDTDRWDNASYHDTVTNNTRLTAPVAGQYLIGGNFRFASNATGWRNIQIRLNATTVIAILTFNANATAVTDLSIATYYQLAAGDYAELLAGQTSGAALNIEASGNFSPEFWIARV